MLTETPASSNYHLYHHLSGHSPHHASFGHYGHSSVSLTGSYTSVGVTYSPSPSPSSPAAPCQQPPVYSSTYGSEIEQLESLAIALCSQEIVEACQSLEISQDPLHWSACDVASWISWQVEHKNWPPVSLEHFAMNGMELSLLTEDDFIQRAPQCGSSLFAQLDVWKLAGAISTSSHGPTCSPVHSGTLDSSSDGVESIGGGVGGGGSGNDGIGRLYTGPIQTGPIDNCQSKCKLEVECMSPPSCILSPYASSDSLPSSPHTSSSSCDSPISSDMDACGPLSPMSTSTLPTTRTANHIHLWQFLKELLSAPQLYGSSIRWLDRSSGVFKIEDSVKVARLWGKRKNRPAMNYDKLSRSIRQYYKKGIMRKTERSQRLVYQFCHPYSH